MHSEPNKLKATHIQNFTEGSTSHTTSQSRSVYVTRQTSPPHTQTHALKTTYIQNLTHCCNFHTTLRTHAEAYNTRPFSLLYLTHNLTYPREYTLPHPLLHLTHSLTHPGVYTLPFPNSICISFLGIL